MALWLKWGRGLPGVAWGGWVRCALYSILRLHRVGVSLDVAPSVERTSRAASFVDSCAAAPWHRDSRAPPPSSPPQLP